MKGKKDEMIISKTVPKAINEGMGPHLTISGHFEQRDVEHDLRG